MNRVFENNPKSLILREINFSFLFHYFLVDEDRNYTTCYSSQGVVQIVEEAINYSGVSNNRVWSFNRVEWIFPNVHQSCMYQIIRYVIIFPYRYTYFTRK